MALAILLFVVGLVLLIKGGDWFVDGSVAFAKRFKIPEILIGATVVSIGTTLPEVLVSATSAVTGHGEIAYGNAVGSIICNTCLIAALTFAIRPVKIERKSLLTPTLSFFVAAIFYVIIAYLFGRFDRWAGIILLVMFVIYMAITIYQAVKKPNQIEQAQIENENEKTAKITDENEKNSKKSQKLQLWIDLGKLIIGAVAIAGGARLLVDNVTIIARTIGISEAVIGLTVVALGTSLPELITAITALVKGHNSLSLGNVIGANLFNLVLVCGVSITLNPFVVPANTYIWGINSSFIIDIPLMFVAMLVLTLPTLISGKMRRWQGIALLAAYIAFTTLQFVM